MNEDINRKDRKNKLELFLQAMFISIIVITIIIIVIEFAKEKQLSLHANIFIICISILLFMYLIKTSNAKFSTIALVTVLSLFSNALLFLGEVKDSGMFVILVPLGFFLLFSLKHAILLTVMHFTLSLIVFSYGILSYDVYNSIDPSTLIFSAFYVVLFGFFYHLSIENYYKRLERSNRQKEILLSEVHHRVKNSLNIVSSMLGLQALKMKDERIKDVIINNRLRIDAIAMVHEVLYQHDDFERIGFHAYMSRLGNLVLSMYEKDVSLNIKKSDITIPFEIMIKLGIITNELLINSIKHGVDDGGEISIDMVKEGRKFTYHYRDNGKGVKDLDKFFSNNSLGLKLVDLVTKQLDAKMRVTNDNGLQYKVEFTI